MKMTMLWLRPAFAFAAAVADEYDTAAVPGVGVYDLAGPYAFVGQGSITAADTGPDGQINNSEADRNRFERVRYR